MSQTFNLCIATETITSDAQQLGVTIDDLSRICVRVSANIIQKPELHLQLTYQVTLPTQSLANQFNWPTWQPAQVGFADYLWEETCLECFVAGKLVNDKDIAQVDPTESYLEINASPDGRYALYQFERYRHPSTLPPTPLYQMDGHTRMCINWTDNSEHQKVLNLSNEPSTEPKLHKYERCFGIFLTQLPNQQYVLNNTIIEHIHPCVILWLGETALYFAPSHASPPDFHNHHYWSQFEL